MTSRITGLAVSCLLAGFASGAAQAQDLTIASSMPALEFPFFVHMHRSIATEASRIGGIELIETDGQNQTTLNRPPM